MYVRTRYVCDVWRYGRMRILTLARREWVYKWIVTRASTHGDKEFHLPRGEWGLI